MMILALAGCSAPEARADGEPVIVATLSASLNDQPLSPLLTLDDPTGLLELRGAAVVLNLPESAEELAAAIAHHLAEADRLRRQMAAGAVEIEPGLTFEPRYCAAGQHFATRDEARRHLTESRLIAAGVPAPAAKAIAREPGPILAALSVP